MSTLVDSGAWYALADTSDRHHEEAKAFYAEQAASTRLVTTDLVVAETWTLLHSHLGRSSAFIFWETLRETRTPILNLEPLDLEAGWHMSQAFPDQALSFADCMTFALMERLRICDAFAFDTHFLVYRFSPVQAQPFSRLRHTMGSQRTI